LVEDRALGVRSARRGFAWIHTFVAQARFVRVAVLISAATERAHVVQADVAQEAIVVQPAGQQAISANALFVQRALIVHGADWQANVLAAGVAVVAVSAS